MSACHILELQNWSTEVLSIFEECMQHVENILDYFSRDSGQLYHRQKGFGHRGAIPGRQLSKHPMLRVCKDARTDPDTDHPCKHGCFASRSVPPSLSFTKTKETLRTFERTHNRHLPARSAVKEYPKAERCIKAQSPAPLAPIPPPPPRSRPHLLDRGKERRRQGEEQPEQRTMPRDRGPYRSGPHRHRHNPAIIPAVTPRELRRVQHVAELALGVGLPFTDAPPSRHRGRCRDPPRSDLVLGRAGAPGKSARLRAPICFLLVFGGPCVRTYVSSKTT